jgi:hypothetical protein
VPGDIVRRIGGQATAPLSAYADKGAKRERSVQSASGKTTAARRVQFGIGEFSLMTRLAQPGAKAPGQIVRICLLEVSMRLVCRQVSDFIPLQEKQRKTLISGFADIAGSLPNCTI